MKILRLAFAGVPALALLAAIQCSVGAATTASLSPTKQSCFNGDEKATHHIWLPRGTLSNWDTRPTDQIAGPSEGRQLSFKDRVAYQRAIEDVYWRHRIWPTERPDPKPPLDAVMSQGAIEQKVQDYLRDSELLQAEWQEPITAERLQAEMESDGAAHPAARGVARTFCRARQRSLCHCRGSGEAGALRAFAGCNG